jgi:hypothetical protein
VRLEEDGRSRKHWSYPLELNNEDNISISQQIEELAYEVMWSTLEEVETNSLNAFKNLIKGIESFRRYKISFSEEDFGDANKFLETATKADKKYARAYLYLGNLYNWQAFHKGHYRLRECNDKFLSESDQLGGSSAVKNYIEAGKGYTYNPLEAEAFEHFGKAMVYFFIYKEEKEQYKKHYLNNKKHPAHGSFIVHMNNCLSMAYQSYKSIPEQDRELYFTRMGIAIVHKERAWLSKKVHQDRKQEKISIRCAISEFRHAKYIAEDRNDRNNLRWLNRNLQELDRDLREGKRSWWSWSNFPAVSGWVLALGGDCREPEGSSEGDRLQDSIAYQGTK